MSCFSVFLNKVVCVKIGIRIKNKKLLHETQVTSKIKTELLPRPRVTSQDVTAHTVPALLRHIKQDAERGSVLLGEWGGPAQEAYLGQPRTMGSWRVYLFCILLCAIGQFYSCAQIQTEEYKTKYLPYFSTAEDSNEKQLVSCTSCLLDQLQCFQNVLKSSWPECLMNCLF